VPFSVRPEFLKEQYDLLSEKIQRLQRELILTNQPEECFRLEKKIEAAEYKKKP